MPIKKKLNTRDQFNIINPMLVPFLVIKGDKDLPQNFSYSKISKDMIFVF